MSRAIMKGAGAGSVAALMVGAWEWCKGTPWGAVQADMARCALYLIPWMILCNLALDRLGRRSGGYSGAPPKEWKGVD